MAQCKAGNSILILPSTSYEIGSSTHKKPKTPKKTAGHVCGTPGTDDLGGSSHDPRNFLVRGGQRALEQRLLSMNKSAMQELRNANAVLAEELLKARSGSDQVRDQLREKELSIDALQATIERMEKARKLLDKKHLLQLKELNRRYKEEQGHRLALEAECAQLRASKDVVQNQLDSLHEERAQLIDMLNSQRSNTSRLEATIAADAATIAELRSRVQTVESRLSDEVAARQDIFGRHKALEADLKLVTERHSVLVASSSEAEARVRAATSKLELLGDELEATKKALQAEKAAFTAERQRASSLQSDLTQLQTSAQLAAAAAAADQTEMERLRGQTEHLMTTNEALRVDIARLREEVLHLTSQQVAAKAGSQALHQQRDELQQQRDELQQQLVEVQESRERLERSLREEVAARSRAVQEAESAKQRACNEELNAKQRQWEGQLRTREKAWEDDRVAMLRAHQEELTRKDMELLEVRERMREAQASVAEMAAEVSTFKFQGQHYAEVFRDNEELKLRLARADETIEARDASLAESSASHAAQLELWKAEANEVAQAAAKWKQRCTTLQAELEVKESDLDAAEREARLLAAKLSTSETERVRLQEMLASAESKLNLANQEASSYRVQIADVLASNETLSRQVEATQQDLQLRDLQISKLTQSLHEEETRVAQLREELTAALAQHAKELDTKRRSLNDLTDQLQETERERAVAQADADRLRDKVALLTREVGRARMVADMISSQGVANAAAGLRRSADAVADACGGYAHRPGSRDGEGGAARLRRDSLDIDDDMASDRRPYPHRGGGRSVGGGGAAARPISGSLDLDDGVAPDRRPYQHGGSGRTGLRGGAATRPTSESLDLDDGVAPDRRGNPRRGGARGGGGSGSPAQTRSPVDPFDPFDLGEEEAAVDRRTRGGRRQAGQQHEYDITSMEEEAEDWFRSLDQERRTKDRPLGRENRRPASRNSPPNRRVDQQRILEAPTQNYSQQHSYRSHNDPHAHPHLQPHSASVVPDANPPNAEDAGCFKTYDVTISAQPGVDCSEGGAPQGGLQPPAYRPPPQGPSYPTHSGSTTGLSAGGAAAAAATAYTAVVASVEQGPSGGYSAQVAATPHPTPVVQQPRVVPPMASSSPSNSAARYPHMAQRQPYRAYGAGVPQHHAQYPYIRTETGRAYGTMTPMSPVFSESASTASSSLQERLQRLLGTGKLS
ncbi:hypothetical protein Vafri_16405 [Volvox africanus]|uniref:Uncharacterized protein n=1 Tax=Volvox africanus TaxID=51714 RepID=A0A8J4BI31_9CHLO|nr:hypothetical protein Vafri_16405 [Volvox africanus]